MLARYSSPKIAREMALARVLDIQARCNAAARIEGSVLGMTGRLVEPVFRPLGWDWRVSMILGALLTGLLADPVIGGATGSS